MKKLTAFATALIVCTSVCAEFKFNGSFAQIGLSYKRSFASVCNETFHDDTATTSVSDIKNRYAVYVAPVYDLSNFNHGYAKSNHTKIRPVGINSNQDIGVTTHTYSFDVRGNNLSTVARLGYKF
jgi:hypothetical protein